MQKNSYDSYLRKVFYLRSAIIANHFSQKNDKVTIIHVSFQLLCSFQVFSAQSYFELACLAAGKYVVQVVCQF